MGWVRIGDEFASHPKVTAAGPLGLALQVAALCYCNRYLTDGYVPRGAVPTLLCWDGLAHRRRNVEWQSVVDLLVSAGLWTESNGGWLIHDYLQFQTSREYVEAKREAARLRMARVRSSREHPANNAGSSPYPKPKPKPNNTDQSCTTYKTRDDLASRVSELEAAYPDGLATEARQACANSRRTGRMADSVWLAVLERLAKLPVPAVVEAMTTFVDKWADGEKDEAYLQGIARRLAKGQPTRTPQTLPAAPASAFTDEDTRL